MENQQLINGLQWLGGGLIVLLSTIGAGGLLLAAIKRYWSTADKQGEIHETNQGKAIDQDVNAFNIIAGRLDKLEDRFDALSTKYSTLMADHAGIIKENEFLKKDNERLQREVERLDKESSARQGRILELEKHVQGLTERLDAL